MAGPTVTLQSITGVDVELRIAGPGSRSYAFVIDWHIRGILALAWFFAMLFLFGGLTRLAAGAPAWSPLALLLVQWSPWLIYFGYHPVLEVAMRGRTPGKRMAGVRIVSRTGDIPGVGALLLRNVFRLIDSLPGLYLVGLGSVMLTKHNVRIGDLAAGTLLVHDSIESEKSLAHLRVVTGHNHLDPQVTDLAQELLDRWKELDDGARAELARTLIRRIDSTTDWATTARPPAPAMTDQNQAPQDPAAMAAGEALTEDPLARQSSEQLRQRLLYLLLAGGKPA